MAKNEELKSIIGRVKLQKGLTQAQIADELGVKPPYLSDMINERVPFTDSLRKRISELYSDCIDASNGGNVQGTNNSYNSDDTLRRALDALLGAQKLAAVAQAQTSAAQSQIDRLLSLLERSDGK